MKEFYLLFISRPIKLLISNGSIFIYTAFFIWLDKYFDIYKNLPKGNSWDSWIYTQLPNSIINTFLSWKTLLVLVLIYLFKSFIITFYAFDLLKLFSQTRKNVFVSLYEIKIIYVIRFVVLETIIYVIFGIIAMIIYIIFRYIWLNYQFSTYFFLIIFFVLLYPLFYMSVSIAGFLSVLPLKIKTALKKIELFLSKNAFTKLYLFYGARGVLELSIFAFIPYIILSNINNVILSSVLIAMGLSIPNVVFKGSSFSFKLHLLKEDENIKEIFSKHYTN